MCFDLCTFVYTSLDYKHHLTASHTFLRKQRPTAAALVQCVAAISWLDPSHQSALVVSNSRNLCGGNKDYVCLNVLPAAAATTVVLDHV